MAISATAAAAAVLGAMAALAAPCRAGPAVVVELFTSQGCNACPPADALLEELAAQPDVIALALHVDYWNYLGWSDTFAAPEHTRRQKRYARAMGERMIYTPQIVVDGGAGVVGSDRKAVEAAIAAARARPAPVRVSLTAEGDMLRAELSAAPAVAAEMVYVVYDHPRDVAVERGENGGHVLRSTNTVRALMPLGPLRGGAASLSLPAPPDAKGVAVLAQDDAGRVLGAARIEFAEAPPARP